MEKILYEIQSLNKQKIQEDLGCYIEIYPKFIKYHLKFFAEEDKDDQDKELGAELVERNYTGIIFKERISILEKEWLQFNKLWVFVIQCYGVNTDPRFYFKKESDCQSLMDKIMKYVEPV